MPVEILPTNIKEQLIQTAPKLKSGKFVKEDVKFLAKMLKINKFFLNKSISDDDLTFLSPISIIFYYLQIHPESLRQIVSKDKFSKINENICDFFKKLDVNFNVPRTAPDFEQEAFRRYKAGLAKNDINSIYYFIESVERGRDVYPNFFCHIFSSNIVN